MPVTLITGATRGLGRETARRLRGLDHTIYVGARDFARGAQVAATLDAIPIQLNVDDDESVTAAAERLRAEVGHLDVLINNAGIAGEQRPPAASTIADLSSVFETNVIGCARTVSACTPLLEASESPVVVNVSSAVGSLTLNSRPDAIWSMLAYPMSKAALNMLTIQYARAFPRWRVNSVTPGLTATDFTPEPNQGGPVEENVEIIVRMATIGGDGPTGTFLGNDGPVPW